MLMENRMQDSHDVANAKKPRSLDLQTVYDQNPGLSGDKKQNQTGALKRKRCSDDSGLAKKKSKKELPLSSVPSGRKIKKSLGEVYKGGSSSVTGDLNQTESEPSQKSDDKANGFDGVALKIGNDILQIPKRRRDLGWRKKADVSNRLKHEGILGGKVSSNDMEAALNVVSIGKMGQDGEIIGKPDQNGNSTGSFSIDVGKKIKRKKGFNEQKESRSSKSGSLELLKKENGSSHAHTGDPNKVRRNRKKKETGIEIDDVVKDAKPMFVQTARIRDKSLDDDQENLEANAARMLSSRFDPSCTGFSSDTRSSNALTAVPSGRGDADHGSNMLESDVVSDDKDVRVLRPRDQCLKKGVFRKRRHFYEVLSKDVDSYWMVKRKIKVYWPLDQIWYFGKVLGYDPKRMLHHIKYDDREEEWIDLQNERFKLLMFPSELPLNAGRRASGTKGKYEKVTLDANVQDGYPTSIHMDGEPIISWLARSTGQMKSSLLSNSKKQKTFEQSGKGCPLSSTAVKGTASESVEIRSAQNSADKRMSNLGLSDSSFTKDVAETSLIESSSRYPVVYFRRRFRRKESDGRMGNFPDGQLLYSRINSPVSVNRLGHFHRKHPVYSTKSGLVDSLAVLPHRSLPTELCSIKLPHFDDDLVIFNLSDPVIHTEILRFKLIFLPFLVPYYSFGVENLRLIHAALMIRHGTLICLWPRVHLEMLFVDNFVGLRLLLFEGCLVEAIAFVFSILNVFHQSNQQRTYVDEQLPVTSIWFQFSCLEDFTKQLVFALHNFRGLKASRRVFLDRMLQKHCFFAKQLPPSECTYDNIQALQNGSNPSNLPSVSLEPSSRLCLQKTTRQPMIGASATVNHSKSRGNSEGKLERLPSFALSISSAPTFSLSLQLKLLMECSIPCVNFKDRNSISAPKNVEQGNCCPDIRNSGASVGCEDAEIIPKAFQRSQDLDDEFLNNGNKMKSYQCHSSVQAQPLCPKDHGSELEGKTVYCPLNGITVEIPSFDSQETPSSGGPGGLHNAESSELPEDVTDGGIYRPIPTASRSSWRMRKVGSSLLGNLSGGKPDLLCSGPKKPRTQVSYSVPLEGHDFSMKYGAHHTKGFSSKHIRRASKKKQLEAPRVYLRDTEALSCDVNVLVSKEDRGWREEGAKVVLELVDDSQWRLAVKILGCTWYAYKAPQFLQSGTSNRYTHAMMWKGGKHWTLEFPDRSQWILFKEMHEECYNRNFRAASVKNIPIPGVRLIEENEVNGVEIPFVRSSPRYIRQLQSDVDIAMDPSRIIYDMDSDDELWISKLKSSDVENCEMGNISDEMFEQIMDTLEKVAYAKQQDHFTSDELGELIVEGRPVESINLFYEHWLEKRQKRGMPLLRHLQPPLWEKYQQQVKELESAMYKSNETVSTGCHGKTFEKPPLYAFCMKPRGLEMANNRGTKHRSQKKHPVTGHGNVFLGDPESFHLFGRRFNGCATGEEKILYHHGYLDSPPPQASARLSSPRDVGGPGYMSLNSDGYGRIHYPRLHRTKSRKIGNLVSPNDRHIVSLHSQRFIGRSPSYFHPDGPQRLSFKNLDPSDLDEFRLRDASGAAQHAVTMAMLKRENAQRLLYKADLAIHKAVVALMTADAIKASREVSTNDASSEG